MSVTSLPPDVARRIAELERNVRNLLRQRPGSGNLRGLSDTGPLSQVEDGQVPVYRSESGRWEPEDHALLGTTVVSETAYGQASAAGTGTTASKVDHTHGSPSLGTTVVSERSFGQPAAPGIGITAAKVDHTHGTPLARNPQTGFPYVEMTANGQLVLSARANEHIAGVLDTSDRTTSEVTWMASPVGANGWGRAGLEMYGLDDGTALVRIFNDLDTGGAYGEPNTGNPSRPLRLELVGALDIAAASSPPAVPTGADTARARLYYDAGTGKLRLSENGGGFRNIGGSDVGVGAAGSFLVTNTAGTGTAWAATTEIYFDDANNRIGIGATAPQERLAVRDGTAGLISTFFGPVGGNSSIAVGSDKTTGRSLQIGHSNSGDYGWLSVWGDAAGAALVIDNGGFVGIKTTTPDRPLTIQRTSVAGDWLGFRDAAGTTQWHLSESFTGGLDFVETGVAANRLFLKAGGNVGIGRDPTYKLDVDGGVRCSDFVWQRSNGVGMVTATFADGNPALTIKGTSSVFESGYEGGIGGSVDSTRIWAGVATNGNARPFLELGRHGTSATRAIFEMFNDLKTTGGYSSSGNSTSAAQFILKGGNLVGNVSGAAIVHVITSSSACSLALQCSNRVNLMRVDDDYTGFKFANSDATAYVPLAASAFTVNSARSSKTGIRSFKNKDARDSILALNPCLFKRPGAMLLDGKRGKPTTHGGLIADEVAEHIPEAVTWVDGKPEFLDYAPIVARLIKTVQDQQHRLEALEAAK